MYERNKFKETYPFDTRYEQALKVLSRYTRRVPIIVEYGDGFPEQYKKLIKQKYLIPIEYTLVEFMTVIRKIIELDKTKSLCLLTNSGHMLICSETLDVTYGKYKDDDQFLYIILMLESTFGKG